MYRMIMKWVSGCIRLAPLIIFVMAGLCSCSASKVLATERKTDVRVTPRQVPVLSEAARVTAVGKVHFSNGNFTVSDVEVSSDNPGKEKPEVKVSIDREGNLKVDINQPAEIKEATVYDTDTTVTETVERERKLSWWERAKIRYGGAALAVVVLLAVALILKLR